MGHHEFLRALRAGRRPRSVGGDCRHHRGVAVPAIAIVFTLLVLDAFNPLDHKVFQSVFGMIMTLLIAMEFKHSIVRVALRRDSIIQVKTVILIGLIALARKFVILDPEASPAKIAALAGATLALGATYWLLRKRGDRAAETSEHDPSSSQ
ncbi:membrane hypothetical protein [uncultured Desulfovibrio sp.]|uniref:Phosphate-starvation-inducible E-like protein n=1 Tax=uncultured Desulfovibrio sp. TaxID=167968 RepID=A0A212JME4_9BACT|nr:membrane hypothetical protein [uncultured Desulfovibrio sp.]